jgi:hypothetical protein
MKEFFVLTRNACLYQVKQGEENSPTVTIIASKSSSSGPIGTSLKKGTMVAICKELITYTPQSDDRHIENVAERFWAGVTAEITALFSDETLARNCLETPDLQACDSRWLVQTRSVLSAIGNDHPTFFICRYPNLALM